MNNKTMLADEMINMQNSIEENKVASDKRFDHIKTELQNAHKKIEDVILAQKQLQQDQQASNAATEKAVLKTIEESHSVRADTFTPHGDVRCPVCKDDVATWMTLCCRKATCGQCFAKNGNKCIFRCEPTGLRRMSETDTFRLQRESEASIEEHVSATYKQAFRTHAGKHAYEASEAPSTSTHTAPTNEGTSSSATPPYSPLPPTPPPSTLSPWSCGFCQTENDEDANACGHCEGPRLYPEDYEAYEQVMKKQKQEQDDLQLARTLEENERYSTRSTRSTSADGNL
ncbi:MAG: hypothetical protein ACO3XZ_07615 [Ilumatobacteraceae bacterium]